MTDPIIITQIPASIVKTTCVIQATIQAVKKSRKNTHGGYDYAATDDIYAAISAKMGEVGLLIFPLEISLEFIESTVKDGKRGVRAEYQFVVATEDATWTHEHCKRTVTALYTGTQSLQAIESFAAKAFYRSWFKIPTGDVDVDSMPEDFNAGALFSPPPPPPPPPVVEAQSDDLPLMEVVKRALALAENVKHIDLVWRSYEKEMDNTFSNEQWKEANAIYAAARSSLEA